MRSLIFATNNKNKVAEIRSVLDDGFEVISLKEAGIDIDIPEPHATLEENALEKSKTIYGLTGKDCFSEDTGLEVSILNGEPGVRSARYAGDENNFKANISKLLENLKGKENRQAQFRTVISLILSGNEYQFEGICKGNIIENETGMGGFGYDAIFVPEGSERSFGEMTMEEKNMYSHRKKATVKLIEFLKEPNG
ncbi:MAG: RdgB/HAM1 family non-canonical purine NTP pyrophosphatase [Ferruginibacter sp.]|nr:RdgB/HAM1 family non-canonical purine NTP pyrophosphatase [Ferruginibacter sp.]